MVYSAAESTDLFLILGCMTSNFLTWAFSLCILVLYGELITLSLLSNIRLPPLSNMPLSNVSEIKKLWGGGGLTRGFTLVVNRALNILLFKLVLFFSLSESNVTLVPPTPHPPLLLSSEYFEFTLQWTEYSQLYNDSPVIFVLEVKRHENISDPSTFLPVINKYHTVSIC